MELFSPKATLLYKIFILYTEDKCWKQARRHNGGGGGSGDFRADYFIGILQSHVNAAESLSRLPSN